MHSSGTIRAALELASAGANPTDISRQLRVPRRTVADWLRGDCSNQFTLMPGVRTTQRDFVRIMCTCSGSTSATGLFRRTGAASTGSGSRSMSSIRGSLHPLWPRSATFALAPSLLNFARKTTLRCRRIGNAGRACSHNTARAENMSGQLCSQAGNSG